MRVGRPDVVTVSADAGRHLSVKLGLGCRVERQVSDSDEGRLQAVLGVVVVPQASEGAVVRHARATDGCGGGLAVPGEDRSVRHQSQAVVGLPLLSEVDGLVEVLLPRNV